MLYLRLIIVIVSIRKKSYHPSFYQYLNWKFQSDMSLFYFCPNKYITLKEQLSVCNQYLLKFHFVFSLVSLSKKIYLFFHHKFFIFVTSFFSSIIGFYSMNHVLFSINKKRETETKLDDIKLKTFLISK